MVYVHTILRDASGQFKMDSPRAYAPRRRELRAQTGLPSLRKPVIQKVQEKQQADTRDAGVIYGDWLLLQKFFDVLAHRCVGEIARTISDPHKYSLLIKDQGHR